MTWLPDKVDVDVDESMSKDKFFAEPTWQHLRNPISVRRDARDSSPQWQIVERDLTPVRQKCVTLVHPTRSCFPKQGGSSRTRK
jgi:hypothetical protein